jgi:hypothetical protein
MRRPPHEGHTNRPLHENGTRRSSPHPSHRNRAKPPASQPPTPQCGYGAQAHTTGTRETPASAKATARLAGALRAKAASSMNRGAPPPPARTRRMSGTSRSGPVPPGRGCCRPLGAARTHATEPWRLPWRAPCHVATIVILWRSGGLSDQQHAESAYAVRERVRRIIAHRLSSGCPWDMGAVKESPVRPHEGQCDDGRHREHDADAVLQRQASSSVGVRLHERVRVPRTARIRTWFSPKPVMSPLKPSTAATASAPVPTGRPNPDVTETAPFSETRGLFDTNVRRRRP